MNLNEYATPTQGNVIELRNEVKPTMTRMHYFFLCLLICQSMFAGLGVLYVGQMTGFLNIGVTIHPAEWMPPVTSPGKVSK